MGGHAPPIPPLTDFLGLMYPQKMNKLFARRVLLISMYIDYVIIDNREMEERNDLDVK